MENEWKIPVVDIQAWFSDNTESTDDVTAHNGNVSAQLCDFRKTIAHDIVRHLEEYGALYLVNHGISEVKLKRLREVARQFFKLPNEVKVRSMRQQQDVSTGWVGKGMEYHSGLKDQGDFKEAVNFHVPAGQDFVWPESVPEFPQVNMDFYMECINLGRIILKMLQLVLEPDKTYEESVLGEGHSKFGSTDRPTQNYSHGRTLIYPPLSEEDTVNFTERLTEHTDWGTFTFLMQDNTGGLEVRDKNGVWHDVLPLDGAVLLQAADQLQRWTSGRIRSAPHRVAIRHDNLHKTRESTAYFLGPDVDCLVKCLDGSDMYPPCVYGEYIARKMETIQKYDSSTRNTALS